MNDEVTGKDLEGEVVARKIEETRNRAKRIVERKLSEIERAEKVIEEKEQELSRLKAAQSDRQEAYSRMLALPASQIVEKYGQEVLGVVFHYVGYAGNKNTVFDEWIRAMHTDDTTAEA